MVLVWNPINKVIEAWIYGRGQEKWKDSSGSQVWDSLGDSAWITSSLE